MPLKEGLFNIENGRLLGSKCSNCGKYFFPLRIVCANCYNREMNEVELSATGIIDTFTVSRIPLPGSVITDVPYGLANVKLPEGVIVESVLTDCDVESLSIGMKVQLLQIEAKRGQIMPQLDAGVQTLIDFFNACVTSVSFNLYLCV